MEKVAYENKISNFERVLQTRERLKEADAIEKVTSRIENEGVESVRRYVVAFSALKEV